MDMSLIHLLLVIVKFHVLSGFVFLFQRLRQKWVSFHVLIFLLTLSTFRTAVWRIPTGYFVTPGVGTPWRRFAFTALHLDSVRQVRHKSGTVLHFSIFAGLLCLWKVAISVINVPQGSVLSDNRSAATAVSRSVAFVFVTFFQSIFCRADSASPAQQCYRQRFRCRFMRCGAASSYCHPSALWQYFITRL